MSDWSSILLNAKKTCIVDGNLKKVRYELGKGRDLVEEYNLDTGVLTRRAWKNNSTMYKDRDWEIEIGDPEPHFNKTDHVIITESSNQPYVSRRMTKNSLEWRIRNLPYPLDVYSVTVDQENKCLVIRTTNKKYFKKLTVPDLERLNLELQQENISFSHKFNTLIITYKKPKELISFEKSLFGEISKITPKNSGDMNNCKPS